MMKFCLPFVVYLHLTYPFALYARDLESSVEGASTQALDKEPLHQLLRSLTQDPASYFYHLLPEITDMIADQALAHWTFLHNQRRWTDAALEAARQDREPEHLLDGATVE
ncbi:MAG: hypothetical protein OXT67_11955 [Zetaproteobacteria bacterium]|nr:hypothetical protein [Zetaproteobacteria bacterium]